MDLDRFQYLALMGACLLITLPLELLFGARVWRQPRRLFAALWLPVLLFTLWDELAIARDDWTYNPAYISGLELPVNLPIEELVFFIVIPICGLLTYEAVRRVLTQPSEVAASFRRLVPRRPAPSRDPAHPPGQGPS